MTECLICHSKGTSKNRLEQHHLFSPLIRIDNDDTVILCQDCHISRVHGFFTDINNSIKITDVPVYYELINKPYKMFGIVRCKKSYDISDVAFYWSLYNYGSIYV